MHDLAADGDGRRAGHALKLADDEQVRHAVKRLEEIGKQIGQREANHIFQDAALGQIVFHGGAPCRVSRNFFLL